MKTKMPTGKWSLSGFLLLFLFSHSSVKAQNPVWKFVSSSPFFASPVISNNTIYIGSLDSTFYCLDAGSGKVKWKVKTGGGIRSTATLYNEQIFFFSGDGKVHALNRNTGSELWSFTTQNKMYDPFDYYQSRPVVSDDKLYFGSGDGNVYAVNSKNGKIAWTYKTGDVVHSTPCIANEILYINSFDGFTYALNKSDGQLKWKFKSIGHRYFPKGEMQFSPVLVNDMLFSSGRDYNLYALDAEKGFAHWNKVYTRGWAPVITPSPANDSLVYIGTSDDYLLLCLNVFTGKEIWKSNMKFNIFGACTFSGDTGYVSTLMGKCIAFNRKTGEQIKTYTTISYREHHLDYFKPDDTFRDDIYSILHSNEDLIAAEAKVGGLYSTPMIAGNMLYLSSTDGILYCFKISD